MLQAADASLLGLGWLLAVLLWIPLVRAPGLITPVVCHGSIDDQPLPPLAAGLGQQPVSLVVALIVCLPLLLAPRRRLRGLAVALALAFAVAQLAFLHAFSSVWCDLSALPSVLVVWVLAEPERLEASRARPPSS